MMLPTGYILLTVTTVCFLLAIGVHAIQKTVAQPNKTITKFISVMLLWQVYIFGVAQTDMLYDFSFPPKFALFFIVPSFLFTALFLIISTKKSWIAAIPIHWILLFQSVRIIVETLFLFSVSAGILNEEVTFDGYNFDMIIGLTAPFVALAYYKKWVVERFVIAWNCIGILVLASVIFVFMSSIYNPQLFGATEVLLPTAAAKYPYVLVAGFLMPVAVFLHFLSIVQLKRKMNSEQI